MAELADVCGYLGTKNPFLSNALVNTHLFLADWYSTLGRGRRLTEIEWVPKESPPGFIFSPPPPLYLCQSEIEDVVEEDPRLRFGIRGRNYNVLIIEGEDFPLDEGTGRLLDQEYDAHHKNYFNETQWGLVLSYPLRNAVAGEVIDLMALAEQRRNDVKREYEVVSN